MSNVYLIGPAGAGKSTVGRILAEQVGKEFIDVDRYIEEKSGRTIANIFETFGEDQFRRYESDTIAHLSYREYVVISTGAGAVLDGFVRHILPITGDVILLEVDPETQLARLEQCDNRPLIQGSDRAKKLQALHVVRKPYYEAIADHTVQTSHKTPEEVAQEIIAYESKWR